MRNQSEIKKISSLFIGVVLVLWLLVASVLAGLTEDVVTAESIVNFDKYWAGLFMNMRTDIGTSLFSILTLFGNWQLIIPSLVVIIYFLVKKNKKVFVVPFIFTVVSAEAITFIGKLLIHRTRPFGAVTMEQDFSFPSGHATIAVAFYGYLAYIFIKSQTDKIKRLGAFLGALSLILIIGYSRLYLGVHYISDILGGYLVGLLALIAGISLSEWVLLKANQRLRPGKQQKLK